MERRKGSQPLTKLPSLSPSQLATYWGCTEKDVLDCIFTGALRAHVFVTDMDASVGTGKAKRKVVRLSGHYALTLASATRILGGQASENEPDITVLLDEPPGARAVFDVGYNFPRNVHVRIVRDEIDRYENARQPSGNDRTPPQRDSHRHRERCRALAALFWEQDPEETIESMISRPELIRLGQEGSSYKPETVRNWIKDLCPNRAPGRRPKNPSDDRQ
jgi:hypothetical protein